MFIFELIDEDNYFQIPHLFDQNLVTDANGIASFTGAFRGDYTYIVSMPGYSSVTNDVHIGSDTDIHVVLSQGNTNVSIDLPVSFTEYYLNPIEFNISDYVYDYNDVFTDLTFTYQIISGVATANFDGDLFTITTTLPNTAV